MKLRFSKKIKRLMALGLTFSMSLASPFTLVKASMMSERERAIAEDYEFDINSVTGTYRDTGASVSKSGLRSLPSNTKSTYIDGNLTVRYSQSSGTTWGKSINSKYNIKSKVICGVCAAAAQLTTVLSKANGTIIVVDPYNFLCTLDAYGKKYSGRSAYSYYYDGFSGYDRGWGECVSDSYNVTVMNASCNYLKYNTIKDIIRNSNSTVQYSIFEHVVAATGVTDNNKIIISGTRDSENNLIYGTNDYKAQRHRLIVISTDYKVINGKLYEGNNLVTRDIGPFDEIISNGCIYRMKKQKGFYECAFVRYTHESHVPNIAKTVNNKGEVVGAKQLFMNLNSITTAIDETDFDSFTLASQIINSNCIELGDVPLSSGVEATGDTTYTVDTSYQDLAVRSEKSTAAKKVASLKKGSTVTIVEDTKNDTEWTHVRTDNGVEGYVHTEYLTNEDSPIVLDVARAAYEDIQVSTVDSLEDTQQLMKENSEESSVVANIKDGDTIMIVEDENNDEEWTHIVTTEGYEGYIYTECLTEPVTTNLVDEVRRNIEETLPEETLIEDEPIEEIIDYKKIVIQAFVNYDYFPNNEENKGKSLSK